MNEALQLKYVLEFFDEHLDFINKASCFWTKVITSLRYSMLMQAARLFDLGEFSFDELKYDPKNLPKGNRKELADVIVDYGNNVIAFQIKGRENFDKGTSEDKWVKNIQIGQRTNL